MDYLDQQILMKLKENARQSASDISKEIHLSVSTVIDRIRKMESSGVIESYTVITDEKKTGNDVTALMEISLEHPRYNELFIENIKPLNLTFQLSALHLHFHRFLKRIQISSPAITSPENLIIY